MEKKDQTLEEMEKDDNSHYQPVLESADATPVYKQIGDSVSMHLNIYYPKDHTSGDPKPVVIYFFSGGFVQGSPIQWEETCKYLASRGMVAITADYRVISRNGGNAINCVVDAKSAVRYVRETRCRNAYRPGTCGCSRRFCGGLLANR
ncbi:MAG: alpha/beta hydrolase [Chitinophagales bacterium]